MTGSILFRGRASYGKKPQYLAIQDAVGEAVIKVVELGYNRILLLSNSKGLIQLCNRATRPSRLEQNLT